MGQNTSTTNINCNHLFTSSELIDGNRYLCDDDSFRFTFVEFIRSGIWIECLHRFIPKDEPLIISLDLIAREKLSIVHEYMIPKGKINELYGMGTSKMSKRSLSDVSTVRSRYSYNQSICSDSYLASGNHHCLPSSQLIMVMFHILYPIYASSADIDELQSNHEDISVFTDQEGGHHTILHHSNLFLSENTKKIRDVLLSCTKGIDETDLLHQLQRPDSITAVIRAIDRHDMAITIIDTKRDGFPIVYANKSFQNLVGYNQKELLRRNLLVLKGIDSETAQFLFLHEALVKNLSVKLGLTCYHKNKKSFLNLLSLRSTGRYAVAVHIPSWKCHDQDDLQMVDELLTLLSLIVVQHNNTAATQTAMQSAIKCMHAQRRNSIVSSTTSARRLCIYPVSHDGSSDSADLIAMPQIRLKPTAHSPLRSKLRAAASMGNAADTASAKIDISTATTGGAYVSGGAYASSSAYVSGGGAYATGRLQSDSMDPAGMASLFSVDEGNEAAGEPSFKKSRPGGCCAPAAAEEHDEVLSETLENSYDFAIIAAH